MVRLGNWWVLGVLLVGQAMAVDQSIPFRFEQGILAAEKRVSGGKETVTPSWAASFRNDLFRLESLSRLYEKYPGAKKKFFPALEKQTKTLEGILGKYGEYVDHLAVAKEVKAPQEVIEKMEGKLVKKTEQLADDLEDERWFKKGHTNPLREMREALTQVEWLPYDEDRAFVLEAIAHQAKGIQKALEDDEYDPKELQSGIHELRRNIRWISQYASALNGLVLLDDKTCPVDEYRALLKSAWAMSKYAQLDGPEKSIRPCFIPRCLYVALSRQVELLGDIKDLGESHEFLTEKLEDEDEAWKLMKRHKVWEKLIVNKLAPDSGITPMAVELIDELKRTQLMKKLRESFEGCLKN